jgi:hypothetical protein
LVQQQSTVRGFLASVGLNPEIKVMFQYNPNQLSDKKSATYATLTAPGLLMPVRQYTQGGDRTITFTVHIDGLYEGPADKKAAILKAEDGSIGPELNKYRAFLYPQTSRWKDATGSFAPLFAQARIFTSPPLCVFTFGDRTIDCIVTDVTITETLFNAKLAPLRADVAVTLVERVPYGNEPTPPPGG